MLAPLFNTSSPLLAEHDLLLRVSEARIRKQNSKRCLHYGRHDNKDDRREIGSLVRRFSRSSISVIPTVVEESLTVFNRSHYRAPVRLVLELSECSRHRRDVTIFAGGLAKIKNIESSAKLLDG
jgi:hypothetical protein